MDEVKLGGAYIDIVAKNDKLIAGLNTAVSKTEAATKKMEVSLQKLNRADMLRQFSKELKGIEGSAAEAVAGAEDFIKINQLNEKEIQKVINVLKKQQSTLAVGSQEYNSHSAAISYLGIAHDNLANKTIRGAKGLNDFTRSSANGANSLMQFNRIVQDAPYGVMGITNNIQAFGESFTYLIKQTGSFKTALSALMGSLAGAGGVMFAISAATTLFQLYQSGVFDSANAVDTLDEAMQRLVGTINEMLKIDNPFKKVFNLQSSDLTKVINNVSGQIKTIKDNISLLEKGGTTGSEATSTKIDTQGLIDAEKNRLTIKENILKKLKQERDAAKEIEEVYKSLVETGLKPEEKAVKTIEHHNKALEETKQKYSELSILVQLYGKYVDALSVGLTAQSNGATLTTGDYSGLSRMNNVPIPEKPEVLFDRKEWEEQNRFLVDSISGTTDIIRSEFSNLWQGIFGEANSVFEQIAQMIASKLAIQGVGPLLGLIPGVGGFLEGMFRASGGPVSSNMPYIVGEQGPELIIPKSSGTVIPANQTANILGGGNNGRLDALINSVQAMNVNLMTVVTRQTNKNIKLEGELSGNDIFLSNRRTARRINRTR